MSDRHRKFEVRCPVHGFIPFDDWERDIINHPAVQRLRRIRQLAWTDQVYPGAMHTRFEHSLGVMHIASRLFDAVVERSLPLLQTELIYTPEGLARDRVVVRLAALLHDTGHAPFSHAGEELFPFDPTASRPERFKHEAYSAAVIRTVLRAVIEDHPLNGNFGVRADEVAALLEGSTGGVAGAGRRLFWRELIDGQMDADRMDYLLRDSLHAGVDYGKYDWRRIMATLRAVEKPQEDGSDRRQGLRLGVSAGGIHAAEALVLARYYMFTQVYFHKTRVAYDCHIRHALGELLPGGQFPPPTADGLRDYLGWDDWKVLGLLAAGGGGPHGERLRTRSHFRQVYHTLAAVTVADRDRLAAVRHSLGDLVAATEAAGTSAYRLAAADDIPVESEDDRRLVRPLSHHSPVVRTLQQHRVAITRLYSTPENAEECRRRVAQLEAA